MTNTVGVYVSASPWASGFKLEAHPGVSCDGLEEGKSWEMHYIYVGQEDQNKTSN